MTEDYRNTEYCPCFGNIAEKKDQLRKRIESEHKRLKNHYNVVSDKSSKYYSYFSSIYNCKCGYCGVSTDVVDNTMFEVDHFIPEVSFPTKIEAGQIDNLVLSCNYCNSKKSDILVDEEHSLLLNPDTNISKVFCRDEDFYIRIKSAYEHDPEIVKFYSKLRLNFQFRRLDYLIMDLKHMCDDKIITDPKAYELLDKLKCMRNNIYKDRLM